VRLSCTETKEICQAKILLLFAVYGDGHHRNQRLLDANILKINLSKEKFVLTTDRVTEYYFINK